MKNLQTLKTITRIQSYQDQKIKERQRKRLGIVQSVPWLHCWLDFSDWLTLEYVKLLQEHKL